MTTNYISDLSLTLLLIQDVGAFQDVGISSSLASDHTYILPRMFYDGLGYFVALTG